MDVAVQSPSPPVTMLSGQSSDQETTFTVTCHDKVFERVTTADPHGKALFRVEGAPWGTSWSWRRKVLDVVKNEHLFDFRHHSLSLKNGWVVETPAGREICSLVHKAFFTKEHSAINATVRTEVGEQVLVVMRPTDESCASVMLNIDDTTIAVISRVTDTDASFGVGKDGSVWEARVAAGVDRSLVSCHARLAIRLRCVTNMSSRSWYWSSAALRWGMFGSNER